MELKRITAYVAPI